MHIQAYKTPVVALGDTIEAILDAALPPLVEGDVVAITSKIISLCLGCVIEKDFDLSKVDLIRQEADAYLNLDISRCHGVELTLKHHLLIPSAGIDESNSALGHYIVYPKDPFFEAEKIWTHLKTKHNLNHLGVIITDSHTIPLRRGVVGGCLAWCGFQSIINKIGHRDLFGQPLKMTTINVVDALAVGAVFVMGEGAEQTPLAVLKDVSPVQFSDAPPQQDELDFFFIPMDEDIYGPFLTPQRWIFK